MRKWKRVFVPALAVVAACGQSSQQEPTGAAVTQPDTQTSFTEADNGKTVTLPVNAAFDVVVKGNPSTGFGWEVSAVDEAVVKLAGDPDYESDNADSGMVGVPGMYTLRFRTVAPGETDLVLVYRRSWETEAEPARTLELRVVVTPQE